MSERAQRVARRLQEELAAMILRGRLRDPACKDVIISTVVVSPDLQNARVYVRTLDARRPNAQDRIVEGLDRAKGFLRRELGKGLGLRHVPNLRFFWDDQVDAAIRIESILDEISAAEQE